MVGVLLLADLVGELSDSMIREQWCRYRVGYEEREEIEKDIQRSGGEWI